MTSHALSIRSRPVTRSRLVGVLLAVCAIGLPFAVRDAYFLQVASAMGIAAILAMSLQLLYGYAGQMSFAQAAFFGVGAYTSVILHVREGVNFFVSVLAAVVISGLAALIVGIPTLRLHGHYLAIASLALQMGMVEFLTQASELTGGTVGIFGITRPDIGPVSLEGNASYYQLIAACAVAVYVLCGLIVRSRFGRTLVAVREDETAAAVLGISRGATKTTIFAVSAMIASLAGALYAFQIQFISPVSFDLNVSIQVLAMVVIGGVASLPGAVVGAIAVTLVEQFLFSVGELQFLLYGAWIAATLIFLPGGLVSIPGRIANLRKGAPRPARPHGGKGLTRRRRKGGR